MRAEGGFQQFYSVKLPSSTLETDLKPLNIDVDCKTKNRIGDREKDCHFSGRMTAALHTSKAAFKNAEY